MPFTIVKVDFEDEDYDLTDPDGVTIHDLFNELRRRLIEAADEHDVSYMMMANRTDKLHHDFTNYEANLKAFRETR